MSLTFTNGRISRKNKTNSRVAESETQTKVKHGLSCRCVISALFTFILERVSIAKRPYKAVNTNGKYYFSSVFSLLPSLAHSSIGRQNTVVTGKETFFLEHPVRLKYTIHIFHCLSKRNNNKGKGLLKKFSVSILTKGSDF